METIQLIPDLFLNGYAWAACLAFLVTGCVGGFLVMNHSYERALMVSCISIVFYVFYILADDQFTQIDGPAWNLYHVAIAVFMGIYAFSVGISGVFGALEGLQKRARWKATMARDTVT